MIRAIVTCYTGNDKNYYSSMPCDFTKIRRIKSEHLECWFDNSGHYMPTDYTMPGNSPDILTPGKLKSLEKTATVVAIVMIILLIILILVYLYSGQIL